MQYMGRASHEQAFGMFAGPIPTPNFIQIEEAMVEVHVFPCLQVLFQPRT